MMKKTMIIGIMAFTLLAATTFSVKADEQTYILSDDVGDVIDIDSGDAHPEMGDIDVKQLEYTKDGKEVTIEIEFVDIIEESDSINIIVFLITSEEQFYSCGYLDGEVICVDLEYNEIPVTHSGFGTKKLSFTFNLYDEDERYTTLTGMSEKIIDDVSYIDEFTDIDTMLDVNIDSPINGKTGEDIQFSGTVDGGQEPYTWKWDFDDDGVTDSESQNPKFKFSEPGTYNVTLEVYGSVFAWGFNFTTITIEAGTGDGDSSSGSSLTMFIILIAIIVIVGVAVMVYFIRK